MVSASLRSHCSAFTWTQVSCTEGCTGKVDLFFSSSPCSSSYPCFCGWRNRTNCASLAPAPADEHVIFDPATFDTLDKGFCTNPERGQSSRLPTGVLSLQIRG